ncbi:conserved hypothetical protein [Perkinsus marinus ATCC 50983]|uniref:Intron-binding protein aquarius n=1 Tax=Perkinsus marinus (strain ATCC 50983 / TXsc) TaxID=423536 RepID=C5KAL8_PERM5|nr:conserved hypothetical protein [Perkinsus marinus ATCC 50983]EER18194.1 conserved hypothetical protein [Perkinsus marinus ATCC 50983]|eukprot:XP_002786398.1 conserved hypothetical protein [Perkinsus marinus ATCC 50983]
MNPAGQSPSTRQTPKRKAAQKSGYSTGSRSGDGGQSKGGQHKTTRGGGASTALTSKDLEKGPFAKFAEKWSKGTPKKVDSAFIDKVVSSLKEVEYDTKKMSILEYSGYLEKYLWPLFDSDKATDSHVFSIILMLNEKFRTCTFQPWDSLTSDDPQKVDAFFQRVFKLSKLEDREKAMWIQFLDNAFLSLEVDEVCQACLRLVGLPCWLMLSESYREFALREAQTRVQKRFKSMKKKYSDAEPGSKKYVEVHFIPDLIDSFFDWMQGLTELTKAGMMYMERFIEFLIDLQSQLPTRRFTRPLLHDRMFVDRAKAYDIVKSNADSLKLFMQLIDILDFYENFEVNDYTAEHLDKTHVEQRLYFSHDHFRQVCFDAPEDKEPVRDLGLLAARNLDTESKITSALSRVSDDDLVDLCAAACRVDRNKLLEYSESLDPQGSKEEDPARARKKSRGSHISRLRKLCVDALVHDLAERRSQLEYINGLPLFPDEKLLWDPNLVPSEHYSGEYSLALPKLNLQFLTISDYLLRNFKLYRLESTYEIRGDFEDVIPRLNMTRQTADGPARIMGQSRMAVELKGITIVNVRSPNVGETIPSEVRAEITYSLRNVLPHVKQEWDELREHDCVFMLSVDEGYTTREASTRIGSCQIDPPTRDKGFKPKNLRELTISDFPDYYGVKKVRGAVVIELLDEEGNVLSEYNKKEPVGDLRTLKVHLDCAQYAADLNNMEAEIYSQFNVLVRRKAKENNFRSVLATIRGLMSSPDTVIPDWLHDLFLGYGDPSSANYRQLNPSRSTIDFRDTFVSKEHLLAVYPNCDMTEADQPPYQVFFAPEEKEDGTSMESMKAKSVVPEVRSPFPQHQPKKNTVPFTKTQVEAIRSGVSIGLTMVVGPPGTGKTDVAVQIVNLLYHNNPNQKTLLIAHSNQALNDLFTKIQQLDIPGSRLLRLGRGQELLELDEDYSKMGRVSYMLQMRLDLLEEVKKLAVELGQSPEDNAFSVENAMQFYRFHVVRAWQEYCASVNAYISGGGARQEEAKDAIVNARQKQREKAEDDEVMTSAPVPGKVGNDVSGGDQKREADKAALENRSMAEIMFPFQRYFASAIDGKWSNDIHKDLELATVCWRHIEDMFTRLEETHPFELLRNSHDRGIYLLTTHAKIVAMTCTHAALVRDTLLKLSFQYDNIVMEEAGQVLEIETFIPMLLQKKSSVDSKSSRLKRVVLIGDHQQLPPVVKNRAFQRYGRLDQSLFARFVRLKSPTINLDMQGRTRPSIANLYRWRYPGLGDLPNTRTGKEYNELANTGLTYEYQFIDVPDFEGQGESSPSPYFYQNLGEAEYCVAMFMYMRLLGYPADKITILATYNGQKHLIRDVIKSRCSWNPLFGQPKTVTTVDRYQGQQNDYVIVSLVRTNHVGHIRDIRRLTVALSRARFGLYIFGRLSLFRDCLEMAPVFNLLLADSRPTKLSLQLRDNNGKYPTSRSLSDRAGETLVTDVKDMWNVIHGVVNAQASALDQSAPAAGASSGKKVSSGASKGDVQAGAVPDAATSGDTLEDESTTGKNDGDDEPMPQAVEQKD